MARVTIEDCVQYVDNRFELVLIASQRGKELNYGAPRVIEDVEREKEAVIALKEIAEGKLSVNALRKSRARGSVVGNNSEINIEQKDTKSLASSVSPIPQNEQIYQDEETK